MKLILAKPHPARGDGSYESTHEVRWEPCEIRDIDPARAAVLLADYPGIFALHDAGTHEAPGAAAPAADTDAAPKHQDATTARRGDVTRSGRKGR